MPNITAAGERGLKFEIAEQFHRRPLEQIKLKLLAEQDCSVASTSSFSDFAGHGYHGISVMRSYLGFDARPIQVTGSVHEVPPGGSLVAPGGTPAVRAGNPGTRPGRVRWRAAGSSMDRRRIRFSPALVAQQPFPGGKRHGYHHRGRAGGRPSISACLRPAAKPPFITLERRWERVDGGALVAWSRIPGCRMPMVVWENPFRPDSRGMGRSGMMMKSGWPAACSAWSTPSERHPAHLWAAARPP